MIVAMNPATGDLKNPRASAAAAVIPETPRAYLTAGTDLIALLITGMGFRKSASFLLPPSPPDFGVFWVKIAYPLRVARASIP